MHRLRRLAAALVGVLLLQLSLLGSGTLCGMRGAHHGTDGAGTTAVAAVHHHATHHDGCPAPLASDACASLAACAVVIAALPERVLAATTSVAPGADVPEPIAARAGPTFAPELPPPRG